MFVFYIIYTLLFILLKLNFITAAIPYDFILCINYYLNTWAGNLTIICYLFNFIGYPIYFFLVLPGYILYKIKVFYIKKALLIGLIFFHPPLFYLTLFSLFYYYYSRFYYCYLYLNNFLLIYITLFGALLGGFWSYNSGVWGYYWVNDIIEYIYLGGWVALVLYLHLSIIYFKKNNFYFYFGYLSLLYILVLVRLKVFNSRHSFIGVGSTKINLYLLYIYSILNLLIFKQNNFFFYKISFKAMYLNLFLYLYFYIQILTYIYFYIIININIFRISNLLVYIGHFFFFFFYFIWYLKVYKIYNLFYLFRYKCYLFRYKCYLNNYFYKTYVYYKGLKFFSLEKFFFLVSKFNIYVYKYKKHIFNIYFSIYNKNNFLILILILIFSMLLTPAVVFEFKLFSKT